jgi:hypothetical protein
MREALDKQLVYSHARDCYTAPLAHVRNLQIAAMNKRIQDHIEKIKVVRFRAEKAGIGVIEKFADVVPLLPPYGPGRAFSARLGASRPKRRYRRCRKRRLLRQSASDT